MASGITSMNPSLSISKTSKTLHSKMTSSPNKGIFSSCSSVATTSPVAVPQKRCHATSVAQTRTVMEISGIRQDDVIYTTTPPALAEVWREIQGSNDWHELVDPLDPLLRDEVIRYGEFVSACYKAFDLDPSSKRYLKCKHGRKNILKEVGLGSSGYEVTKYVYSTPGIDIPTQDSCGRWIGYVAVSSDSDVRRLGRRDIMVALRGTVTNAEWVANLMSSLTPARLDPHNPRPDVKVESGFLSLYASDDSTNKFSDGSCRQQLLCEIKRLVDQYKHEDVSITLAGHSMGSSLALLFAYDLAELGLNVDGSNGKIPITVYSFAGPRVGNVGFKERCEELGVKVLRVVNVNDPITKLPGVFLNENYSRFFAGKYELPWRRSCYAHVGVELGLDFFKVKDPSCVHDLEHLIRLLRCSKIVQAQEERQEGVRIEVDLFHKARDFFESQVFFGSQTLDSCLWQDAAINVCNMIQSLGCIY